jgi:hypothetical protein
MRAREISTARMLRRYSAVALFLTLSIMGSGGRAAPADTKDWPCQQRLVPTLGGGAFWTAPPLESAGDWKAEPRVAGLVDRIAPRRVSAEEGVAAIAEFAASLDAVPDKDRLLTLAFSGLLEVTNRDRADLISRLMELGRRQHDLADIASKASSELRALPAASTTPEDSARRSDLEQRFAFVTQAFESTQRTMRYACEAPIALEARLGRYAQGLKEHL